MGFIPKALLKMERIKSILNKAEGFNAENSILVPQSESERALMLQLAKFNEVIELSFRDRAPHKICEFIYELSNNFNKFYNDTRILSEEGFSPRECSAVYVAAAPATAPMPAPSCIDSFKVEQALSESSERVRAIFCL